MPNLDQERTRFHEYMRPRYSNPTFSSQNMGTSLFPIATNSPYLSMKKNNYNSSAYLSNKVNPELRPQNKPKNSIQSQKPQSGRENKPRSSSHLSGYGSQSLGKLPKYNPLLTNERDIYEKQQKKYNIITMMPKAYNETIKKYPKYHLENYDGHFYQKMKLQDEYRAQAGSASGFNMIQKKMPQSNGKVQMNQFKTEGNSSPSYYKKTQTPHMHDSKNFRPKMLNNIDELTGMV